MNGHLEKVSPLEILKRHSWDKVDFFTFSLSLSFFEAVILDALIRTQSVTPTIHADLQGVESALSELGAIKVGLDYNLEPVTVKSGVFHPKLTVLKNGNDINLLVGSGNLTFGGWGANLEIIELLTSQNNPSALQDAAGFLEDIIVSDSVWSPVENEFEKMAHSLRKSTFGRSDDGSVRLLHNVAKSIPVQLRKFSEELGGARSLIIAAPFYDLDGVAIKKLCEVLQINDVKIHVHPGEVVQGQRSNFWPWDYKEELSPIEISFDDSGSVARRLHLKLFEVVCAKGRLLLSGSANPTKQGLLEKKNVELSVLRIFRDLDSRIQFVKVSKPKRPLEKEMNEEDEGEKVGIVRAELNEDETLSGRVLSPIMKGEVSVYLTSIKGDVEVGKAVLTEGAAFRINSKGIGNHLWAGFRSVIRVVEERSRREAQGFVSVKSYGALKKKLGSVSSHFFAFLNGTGTPEDIAAMVSWFAEDIERFPSTENFGKSQSSQEKHSNVEETISITGLNQNPMIDDDRASIQNGGTSWHNFMRQLFAAFGSSGKRQNEDQEMADSEEDVNGSAEVSNENAKRVRQKIKQNERSLGNFDALLTKVIEHKPDVTRLEQLIHLTDFICNRLDPEDSHVFNWLTKLRNAIFTDLMPKETKAIFNAVVLLRHCVQDLPDPMLVRAELLKLNAGGIPNLPDMEKVNGVASIFSNSLDFEQEWKKIVSCRTYPELWTDVRKSIQGSEEFFLPSELKNSNFDYRLEAALKSNRRVIWVTSLIKACPEHRMALSGSEISKLRRFGVGKASGCCSKFIILVEESPDE